MSVIQRYSVVASQLLLAILVSVSIPKTNKTQVYGLLKIETSVLASIGLPYLALEAAVYKVTRYINLNNAFVCDLVTDTYSPM